ncbi:MAG: ribosomal-processing cysteine protease Prp [Bacilli bacterium]
MIKIFIKKELDRIKYIKIKGHANYDELGKDIVCAAVSSTVLTTINGIFKINQNYLTSYQEKEQLIINILKNDQILNKLIINMIDLLKELEVNYPNNIKIIEEVL